MILQYFMNVEIETVLEACDISLCTHYSEWMSFLISFVWDLLSCEEWEASKKWKYIFPSGIKSATPCFQTCHFRLFRHADSWQAVL